ncbi:ATP-binding cassette subfamily B protein [Archangium gephyra]|uniref:ATP-binding cassette subfamily B protein n=2 Tax=Archangium gephyra TaxID=48 RepID=A0AAC8TCD8_9BACT|nr:Lipid A export ATP-binding/permease protein MsbA [Archangium gephyra]REG20701.1 ATP-binding cassette subfamily B protein [Archangium gephyra]
MSDAPQKPDASKKPKFSRVTVRRIMSLARPQARRIMGGIVFLLIASGLMLVYPKAIGDIIDQAIKAGDRAQIDSIALTMGVVFILQGVAMALRFYLFTTAGERVVTQLRQDLFASLMSQEVGFFDERKTGELTNRLASDTTVLQNAVSVNISMGLRNAAQAVGGIALLLYTSPVLTGLMLLIVPAVAIGAVTYGRRVRGLSKQTQDALAAANEVAEESLSGIRTVRSFAAERHEVERYRSATERAYDVARRRVSQSSIFMAAASSASYLASAVVLWYGGRLVLDGKMTVGNLTSFLIYSMMVAFALGALTDLWADFMRATGAAERVFELIDRKPTIPATGGERLASVQGRVEFQQVRFAYPTRPDVPVLQGIDLKLDPGEVVAIVGPSGAGKSTIAGLLARMYDPQGGRLLLDGKALDALDPEWLRQQIGTVAQEPMLFASSIEDNIRYGRMDATQEELEAAARAANAHEFISRFPEGYRTLVGERGVQLSGGQKQRIAIARAMLKNPRLLVLDEATSALDAESEHLVQEALERLMKGRTTLIIAHRLSTVIGADRVLVLEGGQVVQSGNHAALMGQEGLYRRLVERQFVAA